MLLVRGWPIPCTILDVKLSRLSLALFDPPMLVLVYGHYAPANNGRYTLDKDPVEEDVELGEIKSHGTVKNSNTWICTCPEQMLNNFSDHPCTLSSAGLGFEPKLQSVTSQKMSPE